MDREEIWLEKQTPGDKGRLAALDILASVLLQGFPTALHREAIGSRRGRDIIWSTQKSNKRGLFNAPQDATGSFLVCRHSGPVAKVLKKRWHC